jgi:hypothetical protein
MRVAIAEARETDMPDGAPRTPEEDRFAQSMPDQDTVDEQENDDYALGYERTSEEPDVLLDVPVVKVDEIDVDVADMRARVSLHAEVLDLLKLHVGADVTLERVDSQIKGVEAHALLKVRLDNVAAMIDRVLLTIERNPQLLKRVTRGLATAVEQAGRGVGEAVEEVDRGTGEAEREIAGGVGAIDDAEAATEAPRRRRREAPRDASQAARRAPSRIRPTDQAEEPPPRRSRSDQRQQSQPDERARRRQQSQPDERAPRRQQSQPDERARRRQPSQPDEYP